MISIHCSTDNHYSSFGLNHFLRKYGISIINNHDSKSKIFLTRKKKCWGNPKIIIDIMGNKLRSDIQGYLSFGNEKIPLFERARKVDDNGESLCVFENGNECYSCATVKENKIIIGFNLFNEIGHILSGKLEKAEGIQKAVERNLRKIPLVDAYEKFLFDCILLVSRKLHIPIEYRKFWPDNKKFAVCLTHDVDWVKKTHHYVAYFFKQLRNADVSKALYQIKSFLNRDRHNPFWNFEKIMRLEDSHNVRSTFYFLNEREKAKPFKYRSWRLFSGRYNINDPRIVSMIKKLSKGGWEIGVHGSYYSYSSEKKLKSEKKLLESFLGKPIYGIRQHFLNIEIPETWKYQEKAGFVYDTSLAIPHNNGFRWGTCFPFHPFDNEKRKQLSILEIPLIIADSFLFNGKEPWKECEELVNTVEKYGGVLTVLWHQSKFDEKEFPMVSTTYKRLIEECKKRGAWVATANEIDRWWRAR